MQSSEKNFRESPRFHTRATRRKNKEVIDQSLSLLKEPSESDQRRTRRTKDREFVKSNIIERRKTNLRKNHKELVTNCYLEVKLDSFSTSWKPNIVTENGSSKTINESLPETAFSFPRKPSSTSLETRHRDNEDCVKKNETYYSKNIYDIVKIRRHKKIFRYQHASGKQSLASTGERSTIRNNLAHKDGPAQVSEEMKSFRHVFSTNPAQKQRKSKRTMRDSNEKSNSESIIILDDGDDSDEETVNNGGRENFGKECEVISGVNLHDYSTLEEGEFVNDAIIEFYLNWLYEEKLDDEKREEIHIFSSHFYSKLQSVSRTTGISSGKKSFDALAYERVAKWTKKIDIFSKRIVVFPICEEWHWYVIVAFNIGNIESQESDGDIVRGQPYFFIFDSLGEEHPKAVNALRGYLRHEYSSKRNGKVVIFSQERMPAISPKIPLQKNHCDCGLFLLQYVEQIFECPRDYLFRQRRSFKNWFHDKDIRGKREDIASLLRNLSEKSGKSINFPVLQLGPIEEEEDRTTSSKENLPGDSRKGSTNPGAKRIKISSGEEIIDYTSCTSADDKVNDNKTSSPKPNDSDSSEETCPLFSSPKKVPISKTKKYKTSRRKKELPFTITRASKKESTGQLKGQEVTVGVPVQNDQEKSIGNSSANTARSLNHREKSNRKSGSRTKASEKGDHEDVRRLRKNENLPKKIKLDRFEYC